MLLFFSVYIARERKTDSKYIVKAMDSNATTVQTSSTDGFIPGTKYPTNISFRVIYPDSPKGEYGSAEDPSSYIHLEDPERSLSGLQNAEDIVAPTDISIIVTYPLGTTGPSDIEKKLKGWIFNLHSSDSQGFTRRGIAKAVSEVYNRIYDEEEKPTTTYEFLQNRVKTSGKYGIWGHYLSDLDLHTIIYMPEYNLYDLGTDS